MKFFGRMVLVVLLQVLVAGSAGADETISLKAGYQLLEPEGVFAGTEKGRGTPIDFKGPLDFDRSRKPTAEAALQLGNLRLSAGYLPLELSGRGILTSTVVFNGQTFALGDEVASEVDAAFLDVGVAYYLLNLDDLPLRLQLGPEVSAKMVTGDIALGSAATGAREKISGTAGLPTVGARLRVAMADFFGVAARVGYGSLRGNSFLDLDGQIEFSPVPVVGIYAGYRHLDFDVDESGVVLDGQFAGPYGGMLVRF
jgi:hypothetical protein